MRLPGRAHVFGVHPHQVMLGEDAAIVGDYGYGADWLFVSFIHEDGVGKAPALPLFTPLPQREHCGEQVRAFFREAIFDLAAIIGQGRAGEDAVLHQASKAIREDVARNPEGRLEFLKMMQAVEGRAQDEERPAFAHRLKRGREAAFIRSQFFKRFSQSHRQSAYPKFGNMQIYLSFQLQLKT
jgi:hypothetical protein